MRRPSRRPALLAVSAGALALVACGANGQGVATSAISGPPLETRAANAPDQRPAFDGQTRAPGVVSEQAVSHQVVASGLEHPWGLAELPDGRWLVTERPGRLRVVTADGQVSAPVTGLPRVDARGQGGLLDVALSPSFGQDRLVYWAFSEPRQGGNATSVARGRLSNDAAALEDVEVIFRAEPVYDGDKHFGSALAFDQAGHLYITLGDRSDAPMRPQAQDMSSHNGKVIRINPDGSIPQDNPFVGQDGARPEIWSLGHRNVQGAAMRGNELWTVEHGTRGGDELNLTEAGQNYGWPDAAYGIEYRGGTINDGQTQREGTEQPIYYWDPSPALGNMTVYQGAMFPGWDGNLLIAALRDERLIRLVVDGDRVVGEEHLLMDLGERIRSVAVAADGAVWVITDEADGKLVRVVGEP